MSVRKSDKLYLPSETFVTFTYLVLVSVNIANSKILKRSNLNFLYIVSTLKYFISFKIFIILVFTENTDF